MKRKLLLAFTICLCSYFSIFAQTKEPVMVDAFGTSQCESIRGRLDTFLAMLSTNPDSTGFIFVYEGKYKYYETDIRKDGKRTTNIKTYLPVFGESSYRTRVFRNHFNFRKFSPDRYLFVNGGFRAEHLVELWLVPNGAKPPAAKAILDDMKFRKGKPMQIDCG